MKFDPRILRNDVLCGKGKSTTRHHGNARFRSVIDSVIPTYNLFKHDKTIKTRLIKMAKDAVIHRCQEGEVQFWFSVRALNPSPRYRKDRYLYRYRLATQKEIHDKVSHRLRDATVAKAPSAPPLERMDPPLAAIMDDLIHQAVYERCPAPVTPETARSLVVAEELVAQIAPVALSFDDDLSDALTPQRSVPHACPTTPTNFTDTFDSGAAVVSPQPYERPAEVPKFDDLAVEGEDFPLQDCTMQELVTDATTDVALCLDMEAWEAESQGPLAQQTSETTIVGL